VPTFTASRHQRVLFFPLFLTSALLLLLPRTSRAQDPSSPLPANSPLPADSPLPAHVDDPPPARGEEPPAAHPDDPAPSPPHASEARSGFEASLSLAYAAPSGDATGVAGDSMTLTFGGQFPIGLQVGWAVTPAFFIGAYGSVAPGGAGSSVSETCQTYDYNCSSISFHGGLAVEYRFNTPEPIQPWIGYGIGYESASVSISSPSASGSITATGWEFGRFRAGVDFLPLASVGLGLYTEASVGQYGHLHEQNPDGSTTDIDVSQTALHEWFSIGVRVRFMP